MPRTTIAATLSVAEALHQILKGWHVDGGPGQPGPLFSQAFGRVLAASVIRELSTHIHDPRLASRVKSLGHDLIERGAGELVAGYKDGDTPLVDFPWPLPWPPKKFDPNTSIFEGLKPGALDEVLSELAHHLAATATGHRTVTAR
jgi:hypothetical protein